MRIYLIIAGLALFVGLVGFLLAPKETIAPTEEVNSPVVINGEENVEPDQDIDVTESAKEDIAPETTSPPKETGAPAPQPIPKPAPQPAPKPSEPLYGALIQYTDSGFKPSKVTITEGQVVRFLNSSSREMWVASVIHPQHRNYQERSPDDCLGSTFDQCETIPSGEFWDFKFDLIGTWSFHNHIRAKDDGTVTVSNSN